jgi:hypothetical protein
MRVLIAENVRNDQNYWQSVERYVAEHSEAQFTHTICPPCREKHIKPHMVDSAGPRPDRLTRRSARHLLGPA